MWACDRKVPPFCTPTIPTSALCILSRTPAVPDGVALIKDCPNEENAKLFIDFVTGAECPDRSERRLGPPPRPFRHHPQGSVQFLEDCHVGNYDFSYAASNRDEIKEQFNDLVAG